MADTQTAGGGGTAGSTGGTPPPPPNGAATWSDALEAGDKTWITEKGFKAAGDIVNSYKNLEKLIGVKEKLAQIPDSWEGKEAGEFFDRIGRPKDSKGYTLQAPAGFGDQKEVDFLADAFHKHGLTKRQGENFFKEFSEKRAADLKARVEAHNALVANAEAELKKEWGAAFEQNKTLANEGARIFGIGDDQKARLESALGPGMAAKLLHQIGLATREHSFVPGRPAGSAILTPEQASSKIGDLMKDTAFVERYLAGDVDANRQMQELHRFQAPGEKAV